MDRRRFAGRLAWSLLAGATVHVSSGCGSAPPAGPGTDEAAAVGTISQNHGHEAAVTGAQLAAGGALRLDITGRSTHGHVVDLSADDVRAIRRGDRVSRHSSDGFDDKHDHVVTFN